jgi:hypothetical protein
MNITDTDFADTGAGVLGRPRATSVFDVMPAVRAASHAFAQQLVPRLAADASAVIVKQRRRPGANFGAFAPAVAQRHLRVVERVVAGRRQPLAS